MGWTIVKQPNNLYARFSTAVDHFTNLNMTYAEVIEECADCDINITQAATMMQRADLRDDFQEKLAVVCSVHGKLEAEYVLTLVSGIDQARL